MNLGRRCYKIIFRDDADEVFFDAPSAVKVEVEMHDPPQDPIWRVVDAEGNIVFAGQRVRCICQMREGTDRPDDTAI